MIKALFAVAVAGVLAAGLTLLPAFAPQVEASTPLALAKADRLDSHPDCSQQAWPNLDASCLRGAGNQRTVGQARVVSADHVR